MNTLNDGNYTFKFKNNGLQVGNATVFSSTKSLSFDGNDDYVELANISLVDSATWSCWINPKSFNNTSQHIITKYAASSTQRELVIEFDNSVLKANIYNPRQFWHTASSSQSVSLNTWSYVTTTYNKNDSPSLKLFLNGVLVGSDDSFHGSINSGSMPLTISTSSYPFHGNVDYLEVWNFSLTQSEIQNYMSSPPTGNETGLVGYWNFNEGSGNKVNDLTSNGNNGTINGAIWITDELKLTQISDIPYQSVFDFKVYLKFEINVDIKTNNPSLIETKYYSNVNKPIFKNKNDSFFFKNKKRVTTNIIKRVLFLMKIFLKTLSKSQKLLWSKNMLMSY